MFLWSYRGVVYVLLLFALYSYLIVSGNYSAAEPWINGTLLALIAFLFVRIWLRAVDTKAAGELFGTRKRVEHHASPSGHRRMPR
jgi:hypothetical protein